MVDMRGFSDEKTRNNRWKMHVGYEYEAINLLWKWASGHWAFPNARIFGTEMDLAVITKGSRQLIEVEVKLSLEDWKNDKGKKKWKLPERNRVAGMYYAVSEHLIDKVPDFVPKETGLIALTPNGAMEIKAPSLALVMPITDQELLHVFASMHSRFWIARRLHNGPRGPWF